MEIHLDKKIEFREFHVWSDDRLTFELPKELETEDITYVFKEIKIPMSIEEFNERDQDPMNFADIVYYILGNLYFTFNGDGKYYYNMDLGHIKEMTNNSFTCQNFKLTFKDNFPPKR